MAPASRCKNQNENCRSRPDTESALALIGAPSTWSQHPNSCLSVIAFRPGRRYGPLIMRPSESPPSRQGSAVLVWLLALGLLGALLFALLKKPAPTSTDSNEVEEAFMLSLNRGKSAYERGQAAAAVAEFKKAVQMSPTHPDARLNLANALLLDSQLEEAIAGTKEVLRLNEQSAAAHYVMGCAFMRQTQYQEALKALQQSNDLERNVAATSFQLGRAHQELGHYPDAEKAFQEAIATEPDHPSASYALSQVLVRMNQLDQANQLLEQHKQILAKRNGPPADVATYERCQHTLIRVPFQLEQPQSQGIKVVFKDVTTASFGAEASSFKGPVGVLDINHRGANDLFVLAAEGFRLLLNTNGVFHPHGAPWAASADGRYRRCLVADLQNDRYEDVIVLGENASHVFKFATNGAATEVTPFSGLKGLTASSGALVDLDFTGKLDLITSSPDASKVRLFRNLGNFLFRDQSTNSGIPATLSQVKQIAIEDWNNDDLMDVIVAQEGKAPLWLAKQRGGKLVATNTPAGWPASTVVAFGDLNNDLHNDLAAADSKQISVLLSAQDAPVALPLQGFAVTGLSLIDYDNDGWLDIVATGNGIRCWRNAGRAGFKDVTQTLSLDRAGKAAIESLTSADFDGDGDPDLLIANVGGGLRLLRNEGANANQQLKMRLFGNRSNASGLGIRVELVGGGWRASRTIHSLPIEIGIGPRKQLDSVTVRWFDLAVPEVEVKVDSRKVATYMELILPTGSCPYVYVWDGQKYRFVTDILGAAPLGLPVAEGRYITADTDELVWVGNAQSFMPKDSVYRIQITEELREVLYLDEAKLWVVDHPSEEWVLPTSKLMPGPPFPKPAIISARSPRTLQHATTLEGVDVTEALRRVDGNLVSPPRLRVPQLRGLAETHGVVLDFGAFNPGKPWILAMNGWLRFGGGMANIGASHHPDLPFPFPRLEVENARGEWSAVDVTVGAPAGKTKDIFVDLSGKLPPDSRRLRLTAAFEIHWDRIALIERAVDSTSVIITKLAPATTDLHWRGFSTFQDLPSNQPLSPDYDRVNPSPPWRITPEGFCTRYGSVDQLIARKDNALVLLNGGDELSLNFDAASLPALQAGHVRDFYLFTVGWDKDADFHVARGWLVEPLPHHGQDDQVYGQRDETNAMTPDWVRTYNTRYVGPLALKRQRNAQVKPEAARQR